MSNSLLSPAAAAEVLGCHKATLSRAAKRLGIAVIGPMRVYTPADLERLRGEIREGPGNPLMGAEQPANYGRGKTAVKPAKKRTKRRQKKS